MNTAFPGLLHDSGKDEQQPVFAEPWEAHAFAIAVKSVSYTHLTLPTSDLV